MTKGQFAMLTAVLGLATMGGAGYIAYANTSPQKTTTSGGGNGAAASGQTGGSTGGTTAKSGSGTSTGGSTNAVAECVNGSVQVTEQDGHGGAGHIALLLIFQNVGVRRCSLHGYPGASFVGPGGEVLLNAKRDNTDVGEITDVVLDPGGQASALLSWSDVTDSSEPGGCALQQSANLVVTPPNFTQSTTVSMTPGMDVCSSFEIRPVYQGVAGG